MAHRNFPIGCAICSALAISACAATSEGFDMNGSSRHAPFEWHAVDAQGGQMSTVSADGKLYRGPYLHYQGEIFANLSADDGDRLRCRFRLDQPSIGMSGGGSGDCEATNGNWIAAKLSPERPARAE